MFFILKIITMQAVVNSNPDHAGLPQTRVRKTGFVPCEAQSGDEREAHTHHVELNLALHRAEKYIFAVATAKLSGWIQSLGSLSGWR